MSGAGRSDEDEDDDDEEDDEDDEDDEDEEDDAAASVASSGGLPKSFRCPSWSSSRTCMVTTDRLR